MSHHIRFHLLWLIFFQHGSWQICKHLPFNPTTPDGHLWPRPSRQRSLFLYNAIQNILNHTWRHFGSQKPFRFWEGSFRWVLFLLVQILFPCHNFFKSSWCTCDKHLLYQLVFADWTVSSMCYTLIPWVKCLGNEIEIWALRVKLTAIKKKIILQMAFGQDNSLHITVLKVSILTPPLHHPSQECLAAGVAGSFL